jgi:hypothetical protein
MESTETLWTVFCRLLMESSQSPWNTVWGLHDDCGYLCGLLMESTQSPHEPNVECRKYSHGVPIKSSESSWSPWKLVDEPHGSLFVYFRIFTLLVDDYMITSYVTGITWPIPTFADQLQWFPLICNDFQWFPIIFSNLQWFLPLANISCSLRTLVWYHAALWKFYSSVKQLPRTLACRDIKSARPHQHIASAQHWSSNLEISQ